MSKPKKTLAALPGRALALLAAGMLAACAGTHTGTGAGPEAAPAAAVSRAPVAAGRGQTAAPAPPAAPEQPASPTLQKARAECWMRMETDKKAPREPEKRLPLVEKCVQQKMSAAPPPPLAPQ